MVHGGTFWNLICVPIDRETCMILPYASLFGSSSCSAEIQRIFLPWCSVLKYVDIIPIIVTPWGGWNTITNNTSFPTTTFNPFSIFQVSIVQQASGLGFIVLLLAPCVCGVSFEASRLECSWSLNGLGFHGWIFLPEFFWFLPAFWCFDYLWEVKDFADLGTTVPKKSYHHLGLPPMRPNGLWTRLDNGATRAKALGRQRGSCGSVRKGRDGDRYS